MIDSDKIFNVFNRPRFWLAYIKTQFYYKFFFKHIGAKSLIINPEFVTNPSHIEIGNNVIIHPNVRILCITEFGNQHFNPKLKIGNNVKIQQGVHIACGGNINIEDGVTIGQYVKIFDVNHTYFNTSKPIHSQPISVGKISIGKNSFIGTGSVLMAGTSIGENCFVGANSVIKNYFEDKTIIAGIPAKVIKKINSQKSVVKK